MAARKIEKDEELYNTYNHCDMCVNRKFDYGTTDMLLDYGFVESYPQKWVVDQVRLKFEVFEPEDGSEGLKIKFNVRPSAWGVAWLKDEVTRLRQFAADNKNNTELQESMPKNEYDTVWEFHQAALSAFEAALEQSVGLVSEKVWWCDESWWEIEDWETDDCTERDLRHMAALQQEN